MGRRGRAGRGPARVCGPRGRVLRVSAGASLPPRCAAGGRCRRRDPGPVGGVLTWRRHLGHARTPPPETCWSSYGRCVGDRPAAGRTRACGVAARCVLTGARSGACVERQGSGGWRVRPLPSQRGEGGPEGAAPVCECECVSRALLLQVRHAPDEAHSARPRERHLHQAAGRGAGEAGQLRPRGELFLRASGLPAQPSRCPASKEAPGQVEKGAPWPTYPRVPRPPALGAHRPACLRVQRRPCPVVGGPLMTFACLDVSSGLMLCLSASIPEMSVVLRFVF